MQADIQCINCNRIIKPENINIHVIKCTSRSLLRDSNQYDEQQYLDFIEFQENPNPRLKYTQSYIMPKSKQQSRLYPIFNSVSKISNKFRNRLHRSKAWQYCENIIKDKKQHIKDNIQKIQMKLVQLLDEAILMYIQQANIKNQGMIPQEINRLNKIKYRKLNENNEADLCTICYCQLEEEQQIMQLKCKHIYHPDCIEKWLLINGTCPVCKADQRHHRSQSN